MVIGDILTVSMVGVDGIKWLKDKRAEFRDIDELDACGQRFAEALEKTLKNTLDVTPDLDQFFAVYDSHRKEILAALEDTNITDVNEGVNRLTDRMAELVLEELDTDDINKDDLEEALQTAYREALDHLLKQIAENKGQGLNLALSRVLQEDIEEINENLLALKEQLNYSPELLGRYEPFTIIDTSTEWEDTVRIELSDDVSYFQSYNHPPGFEGSVDDQHVLVYGRKGTGKTRTLSELLRQSMLSHNFDKIILIEDSFTKERDIGSLTSLDYNGDVLLVWDDTHNVSNSAVVESTIKKLSGRLQATGDHELWTRVAIRREQLDNIFSENQDPADLTGLDDTSGFGGIWDATVEVDTDEQFNPVTISNLVNETLEYYNLSASDYVREEFVSAILKYEPAPEYIRSACGTIAHQTDELTETHVEDLPRNTRDIWEHAYSELLDTEYGESRRAILKSLSILDWIQADTLSRAVVRKIYHIVFDVSDEFDDHLEYLESRGWITITESSDRIQIHDIRLEAIEANIKYERFLDVVSIALERVAEDKSFSETQLADEYPSVLNGNFASRLFDTSEGDEHHDLIDKHFKIAVRQAEETPSVHQSYAEYLEQTDRVDEAQTQHLIAKEIRPSEFAVDREIRRFAGRVSRQLDEREIEDPVEEPQRRDISYQQNSLRSRDQLGQSGNYQSDTTKCEICKLPIEPGKTRCRAHPPLSAESPSRYEVARTNARAEAEYLMEINKTIVDIESSESLLGDQIDRNLTRELRQQKVDIPNDWRNIVKNPDRISGFVVKLQPITGILQQYKNDGNPSLNFGHFDSEELDMYGKTVCQELLTDELLRTALDNTVLVEPLVVEIDTGRETVLALLRPDSIIDLIGMSREQVKQICYEEMSSDAYLDIIRPQIVGKYCQLVEFPGQDSADLEFMSLTEPDTVPVKSAQLSTVSDSSRASVPTLPARRATVDEITDATEKLAIDRSIGSSGSTLLPTGQRASRVCITGILTEPVEFDTVVRWGAILHDPFGDTLSVYQTGPPTLEEHLDCIEFPTTVLLTGEIETVTMDDGESRVILKILQLTEISTATTYLLTLETCHHTADRIDRFDDDPGLSQLSRYRYGFNSSDELPDYETTVKKTIELLEL